MALKFNPFTGTLDYTVSAEVEEKAKGVPTGGATSTVLMKHSATNYDDEWKLVQNVNVATTEVKDKGKTTLEVAEITGLKEATTSAIFVGSKVTGTAFAEKTLVTEIKATSVLLNKGAAKTEESEMTFTFGVNESKITFPEAVIKTSEQTITGRKTLEAQPIFKGEGFKPNSVGAKLGTAATNFDERTGGTGGESTEAKKPEGGTGGGMLVKGGKGAGQSAATEEARGGAGGSFNFESGEGGLASSNSGAAVTNLGGAGGHVGLVGGRGGEGEGRTVKPKKNLGGAGGATSLTGGTGGGVAEESTETATAGNGGVVEIRSGAGGVSNVPLGKGQGGNGGVIELAGGEGGGSVGGEATAGEGGKIIIRSGASGSAIESKTGLYEFFSGATKNAEVTSTGTWKFEKKAEAAGGLSVIGTLSLPQESIGFTELKLFSPGIFYEIVALKTYEIPEPVQALFKENLKIKGTLNLQGHLFEVGEPEGCPWILPAPVAPTANVVIPANTQTWFKLNTAVEGVVNVQGQLVEVE